MFERRWLLGVGLALVAVFGQAHPADAGVLDASWTAPTTHSDASSLTDLASYRVYYSTSATPCPSGPFFSIAPSTATPPTNHTVAFRLTGPANHPAYKFA